MTVNLSALAGAGQQFFDNNGKPLMGGKLYSYAAGTTTPQATYTSASGATAHTNPIVLDSAGRVATGEIWVTAGQNYKFVLKTSAEVTIATWDNITGINGTGIATNAEFVEYDPPFAGALTSGYTVEDKLAQTVSVKDFGAVGDGVTDDTAAIQAALNSYTPRTTGSTSTGRLQVYFPAGRYLCNIEIVHPNVHCKGAGVGTTILYSANPSYPVITFGNGTSEVEYCSFSDFSIGERGRLTDTPAGILFNGASQCNVDNFLVYGTSGYGVHLYATGTKPNYFNHFTNFSIDWCDKAGVRSQNAAFGNNGSFFANGTIHGHNKVAGPSYVMQVSDIIFLSQVYTQSTSDLGFLFEGSFSGLWAADCNFEVNPGGSQVNFIFDTARAYPVAYYFYGTFQMSGLMKFYDNTTAPYYSYTSARTPNMYLPRVMDYLIFPDSQDATYKQIGQLTDNTTRIYNNYGYLYLEGKNGTRFLKSPAVRYSGTPAITFDNLTNQVYCGNSSGNFIIQQVSGKTLQMTYLFPVYANNAAALAGGLTSGMMYRTGGDPDVVCIVH